MFTPANKKMRCIFSDDDSVIFGKYPSAPPLLESKLRRSSDY